MVFFWQSLLIGRAFSQRSVLRHFCMRIVVPAKRSYLMMSLLSRFNDFSGWRSADDDMTWIWFRNRSRGSSFIKPHFSGMRNEHLSTKECHRGCQSCGNPFSRHLLFAMLTGGTQLNSFSLAGTNLINHLKATLLTGKEFLELTWI